MNFSDFSSEHSDAANPQSESLRQTVLRHFGQLSVMPKIASDALLMMRDPNCDATDFANLVEKDIGLATEVLSLVNSAAFSTGPEICNLRQAIVRLGFHECRSLILTSCAATMLKNIPLEQEWIKECLWQHSYTTATANVLLNRALNLGFHGEEFTAGLLHDLGRLLIALAIPEQFADVDSLSFDETSEILTAEQEKIATDHCELGSWFAAHHRVPEPVVNAIRWHHQPTGAGKHQKLTALTAAGDHIANHLQRFENASNYDPSTNFGIVELSKTVGPWVGEKFETIATALIDEIFNVVEQETGAPEVPSSMEAK